MKSPELLFLWQSAGPCSRSRSTRRLDADIVDALHRVKVLRPAEAPDLVECPSCRQTPELVEIHRQTRPDGSIRLYGVCPECGVVDLARDDCLRYAVDYGEVTGCLSDGLEIAHPPEERTPGRCWKLGQARIGARVRHVWVCRDEIDESDDWPSGGVAFTLGPVRGAWPEGVLRIPVEDVIRWRDGLVLDRAACDAYAEPSPAAAHASKKPPRADAKRAGRLHLIDELVKELERHILDARDNINAAAREKREWRLPDPPTRKWLARRFGVSESAISRALSDDAGKRAKALLDNCAHVRFVLDFKGKRRKKSGQPVGRGGIV